jgi:hypothetical protein
MLEELQKTGKITIQSDEISSTAVTYVIRQNKNSSSKINYSKY